MSSSIKGVWIVRECIPGNDSIDSVFIEEENAEERAKQLREIHSEGDVTVHLLFHRLRDRREVSGDE